MSTPSPGPGWWLASDGQWYPQRWETKFVHYTNDSLDALIAEATPQLNAYGEQGWEVVASPVQRTQVTHHFSGYDRGGELRFEWSIVCTLKRPIHPGK